jgi:hypothetical protein
MPHAALCAGLPDVSHYARVNTRPPSHQPTHPNHPRTNPPTPPHTQRSLNYFLGVTRVGLLPYVAASWAGMLPGTFAYVFLGSAGRAAGDAAAGDGGPGGIKWVLYGVGAAATILVTRVISQAASKALEEEGGGGAAE